MVFKIFAATMKLFVLAENTGIEHRVSITPDIAKKCIDIGHKLLIEDGAWKNAGFNEYDYKSAGAEVVGREQICEADVIFSINALEIGEIKLLKNGAIAISIQDPFSNIDNVKLLAERKITSFALDFIPRTTRAQYMDVLSSQSSLAGYKAVIEAAHLLDRGIPLMMTTAGTIPAAKVLVIGAGVAGLQAIATAKRLGAIVSAFDVRTAAKEQVESLGAKFIEVDSGDKMDGIYANEVSEEYKRAQEAKLCSVLPNQDVVITTAQIPGKRAPIIIKRDMINTMKRGAIIIDLAAKTGGNCELTKSNQIVEKNCVKILGFDNILNLIAFDASRLFAKNAFNFFELLIGEMSKQDNILDTEDEIIKSTLLTCNGKIVNTKLEAYKNV
jgi:NAD(P) transhydrogenase subunit alpha